MNTKFNRDSNESLYAAGYTDGYNGNERNPHRVIDTDTQEKIQVFSDDEVAEYDEGYKDGRFHFNIDSKR